MNVLLQDRGLPPFDKIKTEDYEPAIRAAIAEAERNVEAIATNPDSPTFENTVEALECASRRLDRISAIMMNLNECCTTDELQEVVMKLEPEMTRFSMKVMTDKRLYKKIENLKLKIENSADAGLSTEQRTLLDNTLKSFRRHGVALEGEEQERYRHNEEELSELKLHSARMPWPTSTSGRCTSPTRPTLPACRSRCVPPPARKPSPKGLTDGSSPSQLRRTSPS